jgi:Asp-tRNA(Asn)/Glu-tRNA(Gln) amidotransferase A subunit family amidase
LQQPLYTLTAVQISEGLVAGTVTAEAVVRSCLERIEEREADVGAWTYLNREAAIASAQAIDRSSGSGLLRGIPVGIKDVVDTADMPTGYGSLIYHSNQPAADAVCVSQSRAAGAIVLGKTVSTEFAFRRAGKTSNPHDRRYSPGGSSSGSAAAVADKMVPLAIGTQTGGSVIRPASYCGIYGLKPTFNVFSFSGVRHLAESFDTLGCMARSLDDIALYRSALLGIGHRPLSVNGPAPRITLCRTAFWDDADAGMRTMIEEQVERLARAGATLSEFKVAGDERELLAACWTINKFEGARLFAYDAAHHPNSVSSAVHALVEEGRRIPLEAYFAAIKSIEGLRAALDADLEGIDALVSPSAPGEPPKGLSDTGPITFNFLWTVAHTPAVNLPAGRGPNGLPLGLQLVGRRYSDDRLLATAHWVDRKLGLAS